MTFTCPQEVGGLIGGAQKNVGNRPDHRDSHNSGDTQKKKNGGTGGGKGAGGISSPKNLRPRAWGRSVVPKKTCMKGAEWTRVDLTEGMYFALTKQKGVDLEGKTGKKIVGGEGEAVQEVGSPGCADVERDAGAY